MHPPARYGAFVTDAEILSLLSRAAAAARQAMAECEDWGLAGTKPGQHRSDIAADAAAVEVLLGAGVRVLSEESGISGAGPITVVLDPLDGSTNASHGLPWHAVSMCAVEDGAMRVALVVDGTTGHEMWAIHGQGAFVDSVPMMRRSPPASALSQAVVGISGWPSTPMGWMQFRALGAVALDLCAVATGSLDGYVDFSLDAHGPWDYMGALLICREMGVEVVDALGRDLVVLDLEARRTPVAAASPEVLKELLEARPRPI